LNKHQMKKQKSKTTDLIVGIIAVFSFVAAWLIGSTQNAADVDPSLLQVIPNASHFDKVDTDIFAAYSSDFPQKLLGYVTTAKANGYGGPMKVAVGVDLDGKILGINIVEQNETYSYMSEVLEANFIQSLIGKYFSDSFQMFKDVDGVTGATVTSRGIANAVLKGSRLIAEKQLNLTVTDLESPQIKFGIPEITLLALFTIGFFGHRKQFKYKKQARWASMLIGMVVLGFIYTQPFTLSDINKLLLGFWPAWQSHLYWYLLVGGIFFVFTADNKNPYCEWFCPFGAAQECLAAIGDAKTVSPGRFKNVLLWTQRGLAWLAIILAILFRNPSLTSYEIFGTLFDFIGSTWQFALLGIILVTSIFILRPWCNYLCPIRPVMDLYRTFRKRIIETWKKTIRKSV
jgi:NosR/NirI family transcriptional regulator, nitrous oxide reductase regulator